MCRPPRAARTSAAFLTLLLAACGGGESPPRAVPPPSDLASIVLAVEAVPVVRELNGVVEAINEATVSAQTSGRVGEVLFDVNDVVPAGAVILRLRGKEQRAELDQAEAALAGARARQAEAQERFTRIEGMYARRVVPKATLDEALAGRDDANAQVAAARAAVDRAREGVSYTEVTAPYGGVVTRRHVEVGESVSPGTPLMSGLSLEDLRVAVDVPQSMVEAVRARGEAFVVIDSYRVRAATVTVFPVADPVTGTFHTRLDLPLGTQGVRPGMHVKAEFVVGEADRMLIPADALVERGEVVAVYVQDDTGQPRLRQIRIGRTQSDGRIEVLSGLVDGERLVLEPAAALAHLRVGRDPNETGSKR
jgi:RND family efflux transporter MFP subunit